MVSHEMGMETELVMVLLAEETFHVKFHDFNDSIKSTIDTLEFIRRENKGKICSIKAKVWITERNILILDVIEHVEAKDFQATDRSTAIKKL